MMRKIKTLLLIFFFLPIPALANGFDNLQNLTNKELEELTVFVVAADISCAPSEIYSITLEAAKKENILRNKNKSEEEKMAFVKLLLKSQSFFDATSGEDREFLCRSATISAYKATTPINALNMLTCSSLYAHKIILAKNDEDAVMKNGFLMSNFKKKGEIELEKHSISKIYSVDYYKAELENLEDLYSQNKPQYIVDALALDKACMNGIENPKVFDSPNFGASE